MNQGIFSDDFRIFSRNERAKSTQPQKPAPSHLLKFDLLLYFTVCGGFGGLVRERFLRINLKTTYICPKPSC